MKTIMEEPKYVLFKFPDGSNFVMRTTLNTDLIPNLESGCVYDMDNGVNLPVEMFSDAKRIIYDEFPEEYRKETQYYETLLYGIKEVSEARS